MAAEVGGGSAAKVLAVDALIGFTAEVHVLGAARLAELGLDYLDSTYVSIAHCANIWLTFLQPVRPRAALAPTVASSRVVVPKRKLLIVIEVESLIHRLLLLGN